MNPEIPVLLAHGYFEDWPRGKSGAPDRFSSVQVLAASELLRKGKAAGVIFDLKCVQPDGQTVAEAMAAQVKRNLAIFKEPSQLAVVSNPLATNTRAEMAGFKNVLEVNHWDNFAALAIRPHVNRVRRALIKEFGKKVGGSVSVLTPEDILGAENAPMRHKRIVDEMISSPYYRGITRKERILNAIDAIPFLGELILGIGDKMLMGNKKIESLSTRLLGKGLSK